MDRQARENNGGRWAAAFQNKSLGVSGGSVFTE